MVDDDWSGMYKHPDNFLFLEKYEAWYQDEWLKKDIPEQLKLLQSVRDVRPFLRAKFMYKYSWAQEGMLYELNDNDVEMAEFIAKIGKDDYDKLKLKYDQLFDPSLKYISNDKLW